jgi:hypothetical protein
VLTVGKAKSLGEFPALGEAVYLTGGTTVVQFREPRDRGCALTQRERAKERICEGDDKESNDPEGGNRRAGAITTLRGE